MSYSLFQCVIYTNKLCIIEIVDLWTSVTFLEHPVHSVQDQKYIPTKHISFLNPYSSPLPHAQPTHESILILNFDVAA